jgi:hypothetical protein
MSISTGGLRTHRAQLLIAVAVSAIACRELKLPFTYDVKSQSTPLPPGVNSDPMQFRQQVAIRGVGPAHHRNRFGKCPVVPCTVEVTIAPVGETREVSPIVPLAPGSGRPVAKIVNLDSTDTERMYGFRPFLLFEYYVWADTAASHTRLTLLEVPATGQPGVVHAIFQKNLRLCVHDELAPKTSDADFRWCEGVSVSTGSNVTHAGMLSMEPAAMLMSRLSEFLAGKFGVEGPIWLRCTDGCCG